jgi:nitrite reductase (NADH) small subunit
MEDRYVVCRVEDLPPGERKIVCVKGHSIGVFNVGGRFYALNNRCPHKGAPLCAGIVTGLVTGPEPYRYEVVRQGEILRCPWHGWEFDITNGRSVFNPHRLRVKSYEVMVESVPTYPVVVEDQVVVLYLRSRPSTGAEPTSRAAELCEQERVLGVGGLEARAESRSGG